MPKDEWRSATQRARYGPIGAAPSGVKPRPIYAAKRKCPKCGSAMVLRNNKATGEAFLGCFTYPACTGTARHDGGVKLKTKKPKGKRRKSRGKGKARPTEADRHMAHLGTQRILGRAASPPAPPGCLSEINTPMGAPF